MSTSATALPGPRWAVFFGPGAKVHMQALADRLRSMSEQDRSEGVRGGPEVSNGFQTRSNPSETLLSQPWVIDLIKMGLAAAFAVGFTYAVMKDGIATGKRGFELALENRAAIASNRTAMEAGFHGIKVSFGKSLAEATKPLIDAVQETSKVVAVMAKGQEGFENEMRNALDRIRTSRSTP